MAVLTHIPQILEEHFEELAFLLHLRAVQISSGKMLFRQFIDLDERLQGHVDGLFAAPNGAIDLARAHLAGSDPLMLRAAAYTLLRLDPAGATEPIFIKIANPALAAPLFDAMLLARSADLVARLKKQSADPSSPLLAAVAMEVLANAPHEVNSTALGSLLTHPSPPVRTAAWHAAQRLSDPRLPGQYKAGCGDADPTVRDAALLAAAWAGQPFVLDFCRPFLKKLTPEALVPLRLWSILAPAPEAAASAPDLAKAVALGPGRFDLLASSGLPVVVPHLLAGMRLDPESAAAAAEAFARMTNYLPPEKGRAAVAPPGAKPGAFDKEFLADVAIPDPDAAAKYWSTVESSLGKAARIARGIVVEPVPEAAVLLDLDCAARDAVLLRHIVAAEGRRFATKGARWSFPQRFTA